MDGVPVVCAEVREQHLKHRPWDMGANSGEAGDGMDNGWWSTGRCDTGVRRRSQRSCSEEVQAPVQVVFIRCLVVV